MRPKRTLVVPAALLISLLITGSGLAQGPAPESRGSEQTLAGNAFSYQGYLTDGGSPANGLYDFSFAIYADAGGTQWVANAYSRSDVQVTDGLFTTTVDVTDAMYGDVYFYLNGDARWLKIGVRPGASTGAYTYLTPLQPLTPTPYALALPGMNTVQNSTSANVIGGYSWNYVDPDAVGATIGGGGYEGGANEVHASYGTVGGGSNNSADGLNSTVPGGDLNTATGDFSLAAGHRAKASHDGVFVWADNSIDSDFYSTVPNVFLVRAANGAYIQANTTTRPAAWFWNNVAGSSAGQGTAAYGRSESSYGYGVAGHNYSGGVGVGAWSWSGNLIEAYDGDFPGGTLRFYVDQAGNVHYDGSLTPFVALPSPNAGEPAHVSLYGLSSTEVWFEDLGSGSLVEGRMEVGIDPVFAQTVALTDTYQVYLTAICQEPVVLFVSEKAPTHFTVQGVDLSGKPSACGFDYRLAAKRTGYEDLRLEALEIPAPVTAERETQP